MLAMGIGLYAALWDALSLWGVSVGWVHIRCCGNGGYGFRSYSGSLLQTPKKVTKKRFAPPLGTSPRLGMPALRLESVGRRNGPSLA
ncbi:MAG: hypothetical protein QOI97_604, partial [Pseudomonas sp.]|nr:hypothetical protein [Pseudomonas sp.]